MITYDQRSTLYTMFEHSTDVIQKVGKPDKTWSDKEGNVNLYGVELEVSTDYGAKDIIDFFPEIFVICKKDSTITGVKKHPIEIVTVPASLRRHKKMWAAFFKGIDINKFDTMDKHNNGMHVHVDRNSFEQDGIHLKKFCWFFSSKSMQEFNLIMSERTKESLEKWSKFARNATSVANVERHTRDLSKYAAVNLGKSQTVEVRLFKGIVSFTSLVKNLEFVDAALEYTRNVSLSQINLKSFLKWLNSLPSSRYRTLRICIGLVDLEEVEFNSALEHFLETKSATDAHRLLVTGGVVFNPKYNKKVVSKFNSKYTGYKLSYTAMKGWELNRVTTKFAKLDSDILGMFR